MMNCPNCGKPLPEQLNVRINFCPMCGDRLYEIGKKYLIQVQSNVSREDMDSRMLMFVDDMNLYEIKPLETICLALNAGFHTLNFRHKIRNKSITLLISSNYVIGANYNTLSGLIETNIMKVEDSEEGISDEELEMMELTKPILVSDDGIKSFDMLTGHDAPEFEVRASSGFKEGVLKIYGNRLEFGTESDFKKELIYYSSIVAVKPKMGSIDIQCEGNVHKVYSIPKDNYNDILAFLTNRTIVG